MSLKKNVVSVLCAFILSVTNLYGASFDVISGDAQILINPSEAGTSTGPVSDFLIFAFDEQQDVELSSNLSVSELLTVGGQTYTWFNPPTGGTITTPQTVNSHFFYTRAEDPTISHNYSATFEFDTPIVMLGFMSSNATLNTTPTDLLHPGTTYEYGSMDFSFFCLFTGTCDSISISADRKTLSLVFNTSSGIDSLRVITEGSQTPIPEPKTVMTLISMIALSGLLFTMKKKNLISGTHA